MKAAAAPHLGRYARWKAAGPGAKPSALLADYAQFYDAMLEAQEQSCKACVFKGISQNSTLVMTTGCKALQNVRNTMESKVVQGVEQALSRNTDVLGSIATLIGAKSTSTVVTNVASRVNSAISDKVLSDIRNQISVAQNVVIDGEGSISVNRATQTSTVAAIQTYLAKNDVFNGIFSDSEWSNLQVLLDRQATIDTALQGVGAVALFSGDLLSGMLKSAAVFAVFLAGLVLLGIIVYFIVRAIKSKGKKPADATAVTATPGPPGQPQAAGR